VCHEKQGTFQTYSKTSRSQCPNVTMQSMKTRVSLKYRGPALDAGRMDVYEAAANMIAFSEFMVTAVKVTYGDAADAKAEVAGFDRSCFVTDLVFSVGGSAATIFTALTPQQLWNVVKGAFDLWKHLKGSPPANVTHQGQNVSVTNNSGSILQVRTESLTLVLTDKGAEAVERFVRQGLNHEGYGSLSIETDTDPAVTAEVSVEESAYFVPVSKEAQLSDNTVHMTIVIVAAVFQDGNKWRFSDGASTFSAAIFDGDFLALVNNGARFGKGDVLEVEMHIVQTRSGMKVSVDRSITKVLRHLTPQEQATIF